VHTRAERRENAYPPIADFIAGPLDHQGAIAGDLAGRAGLLLQVHEQVLGGAVVEAVHVAQPGASALGVLFRELPAELPDGSAKLDRTPGPVAVPERHFPGLSGGRGHEDPIVGDFIDSPRRRAQEKNIPGAGLEDHFFIQLADAAALLAVAFARQVDTIETSIGNGAAAHHRQPPAPLAAADLTAHPIPGEPRPELGKLVGGVTPGEHVEHALE
jgi:hypothetical protein